VSPAILAHFHLELARRVHAARARKLTRRDCLKAREMLRRGFTLAELDGFFVEIADTFADACEMHREGRPS
jgi:hypothetical protein